MGNIVNCRILIDNRSWFRLIRALIPLFKLMHKYWKSRFKTVSSRKGYADILKTRPVLELVFSLKTDGSMSDLADIATDVLIIQRINGVIDATMSYCS